MEQEFNYDQDLAIEPDSLDTEWLEQPALFMRYAKAGAEARGDLDRQKENVDVVKAQLDKQIRSDPDKFGVPKITEGAIAAAITTHEDYKEALAEYHEAKEVADLLQCALRAMDHRKAALENMVKLLGMEYFSGPIAPKELTQERLDEMRKRKSRDRVKNRRRRGD